MSPVSPDPDAAIVAHGLTKTFGTTRALQGIDLVAARGKVLGLLGPNGAGKTTAVRILTTLIRPDSGNAVVEGLDVVEDAAKVRKVIGLAGQYAAVDELLTGRENLQLVGGLYHLSRPAARRRAEELLSLFGLEDAADRSTKTYSGGMRRRLDLAASLVNRPLVLFLDEPTTGLDPRSRIVMWEALRALVAGGTTLLLTTQYLEEADQLAHQLVVIDHGRVIAAGRPDELKAQIGGDVIELVAASLAEAPVAAEVLSNLGGGPPIIEEGTGRVIVPAGSRGAEMLGDVVRMLDERGIVPASIGVRRPSLDEVFLALTGQDVHSDAALAQAAAQ